LNRILKEALLLFESYRQGDRHLADNWLTSTLLPLDRPEYSKQTEALLTDLLWRSPGSSLFIKDTEKSYLDEYLADRETFDGESLKRIVFERIGKKTQKVVESLPLARGTDLSGVVGGEGVAACLDTLLDSLKAPRSRSYRSISAVPLHPDLIVLQTLPGIVNKKSPPNVAGIIEHVGRLGGSDGIGAVAHRFLQAFSSAPAVQAGLSGFSSEAFARIAAQVWTRIDAKGPAGGTPWPAWPGVRAQDYDREGPVLPISTLRMTPFRWFWTKWETLCAPDKGWTAYLPQRRWLDWALTLLRTGLAFVYLWEAELMVRIRERIVERQAGMGAGSARERLIGFLGGQFTLVSVQPRRVPPSQKRVWSALASGIAKGHAFRKQLSECEWLDNAPPEFGAGDLCTSINNWIDGLNADQLTELSAPLSISSSTATNTKEFIKYLMLPRSADDDSSDQADLYFISRSQRSDFWIDLGPEWLVVETAMLAAKPGGKCTLRQLLDDLAFLGIAIDRPTVVALLESTGLSADSPDADDALVIESGF